MTHPITNQAIRMYGEVLKAERILEERKAELRNLEALIPDQDKPIYGVEISRLASEERLRRLRNHMEDGVRK